MNHHFITTKQILERELTFYSNQDFFSKISLSVKDPNSLKAFEQTKDCPICLCEMESDVSYLLCDGMEITAKNQCGNINGHIGHTSCLRQWIQNNKSCPCCRCSFQKHFDNLPIFPVPFVVNSFRNKKSPGNTEEMKNYIQQNADKILIFGGIEIFVSILEKIGSVFKLENLLNHFQPEEIIKVLCPLLIHQHRYVQMATIRLLIQIGMDFPDVFRKCQGIQNCCIAIEKFLEMENSELENNIILKKHLQLMELVCRENRENVIQFIRFGGAQLLQKSLLKDDLLEKSRDLYNTLSKYSIFKKAFKKNGGNKVKFYN